MTGAVNRDFWTCGSFADFVAGATLCVPRSADFVAGTALSEPRSADFVASTDLCEARCRFVAGTARCDPRRADFVSGTALCVYLEVQISWQAQHFVNLEVQIS